MKKTIKKILSLSYNVLRYVMSVWRAKKKNTTSLKIQWYVMLNYLWIFQTYNGKTTLKIGKYSNISQFIEYVIRRIIKKYRFTSFRN